VPKKFALNIFLKLKPLQLNLISIGSLMRTLHNLQNKLTLPLTLQGSTRSSVSFQECEGSFAEDEFVRQEGDAQVGLVC
jgi:hypothetical protein